MIVEEQVLYLSTSIHGLLKSGKLLSNFDKYGIVAGMNEFKTVLTRIGLSPAAQTIYLSLIREGQATARMIAQRTGITRPSVYDHLKVLRARDLIVELDIEGKAVFAPADLKRIDAALREAIEELEEGRKIFTAALPTLLASVNAVQPKVRFFEGKDGVMQLMKDILWHDHVTLHILWPYEEMLDVLGVEFLLWFNERRKLRGITVESIWPHTQARASQHIFKDDGPDVERRFARKDQIAHMGYIIYKNKVAFVSSHAEGFGFIVESTEFADLMEMQFRTLWESLKAERPR